MDKNSLLVHRFTENGLQKRHTDGDERAVLEVALQVEVVRDRVQRAAGAVQ